jgi:sigma-B regulation protein RsbU (phosphoserine phosphatase)
MVARGRLVGVIDAQSAQVGSFGDYERSMLRLIASRVGVMIDNAQLYRRAERQYKTIRTLQRISHEFSSILGLDELLSQIAVSVRSLINYDAFSILTVDAEGKFLKHRSSIRYDRNVILDNIPLGKGVTGAAATSNQIVRVYDTQSDPRYIDSHPGIRSEIAVPLALRDRVIGVMDLESERIGYFTEEHARTLSLLAPSVAIAVENARLYEQIADRERVLQEDLEAAFELQTVLLPQEAPEVPGLEIAIGLRPARQISGDLYDFFSHSDAQVAIAFGDSSGKGAAAALYGAMVSGLMRTLAPRRRSPAELMKALNDALEKRKVDGRFATLLLVLWDAAARTFTMANAGGALPMVCRNQGRRKGDILDIRIEGMPIGLLPNQDYDEHTFQAQQGDLVVLFSDGVSDHQSPSGEQYGAQRIAEVLRSCINRTPRQTVDALFSALDAFNTTRFDDQTLIVLRVQ